MVAGTICADVIPDKPTTTISLDGSWQIAEGAMSWIPEKFDRMAPVPGLVDMARPPFADVGTPKSIEQRQVYWYRRTFRIDGLIREYTEWMQERWNHPSVVIWDAQNETITAETGKAIQAVRRLDLSNRPWDNGNSPAQSPTDTYESHPYLGWPGFRLSRLAHMSGRPEGHWQNVMPNSGDNPIIINEYCYYWLNRDGTAAGLSKMTYDELLGKDSTVEQRRCAYARILAAKTEFWRSHRQCAGVMELGSLSYSCPYGSTSDHFLDVAGLKLEPSFERYVRDAFSPIGVMLDFWEEKIKAGASYRFPVIVINDMDRDWKGQLRLRIQRDNQTLEEETLSCEVPTAGRGQKAFEGIVPKTPGHCIIEATLLPPEAPPVRSLRDVEILPPQPNCS